MYIYPEFFKCNDLLVPLGRRRYYRAIPDLLECILPLSQITKQGAIHTIIVMKLRSKPHKSFLFPTLLATLIRKKSSSNMQLVKPILR